MIAKPTITNEAMTSLNTEYSYDLPAGTRAFSIKLEAINALLKIAFVEGESGTNYTTVPYGETFKANAKVGGSTIYFQSPKASQVAQITTWK